MKRAVIISLIVLFCAAVFGFNCFGEDIREVMSARVEAVKVRYSLSGCVLPSEAVRADENGHTYVMFAVKTDKYPEKGYEAVRMDCGMVETDTEEDEADTVILSFDKKIGLDYLAIVSSDREVLDGRRVIVPN